MPLYLFDKQLLSSALADDYEVSLHALVLWSGAA